VLVAADDDRERRPALRAGERSIVVHRLVRDGHHARAPLLADETRFRAERRLVGRRELGAAEGRVPVDRGVGHDDAEQADAHGAPARALDREDLLRGQRRVEADVGGEPRRAELGDALAQRGERHVVLVVAEHDVRDADRVQALDHGAPAVQAREEARRQEVARDDDEHRVGGRGLGVVPHEGPQARQVLERVDVVDRDDAERGTHGAARARRRARSPHASAFRAPSSHGRGQVAEADVARLADPGPEVVYRPCR